MKTILQTLFEINQADLPIVILIGLGILAKLISIINDKKQLVDSGINKMDQVDGKIFKKYIENLFIKLGFKIETPAYLSNLADFIAYKDGLKFIVQAKHHRRKVSVKAIKKIIVAKRYHGCNRSIVITNSYYTDKAIKFAKENDINLWNRNDLAKALLFIKNSDETASIGNNVCLPTAYDEIMMISHERCTKN